MPEPEPRDGSPFSSENPYQSPIAYGARSEVASAQVSPIHPGHLRRVAIYQKCAWYCLVAYVVTLLAWLGNAFTRALPPTGEMVLTVCQFVTYIAGIVAVGVLAARLHGPLRGVAVAAVSFLPLVNLLSLLVMTRQASDLLERNGIPAGIWGARL